ncbi:hypothetical protein EXD76_00865 [BEV proteobacterium]|nr:hypothetical protein [Candidatus Symbiopectobacterium sp. Chty_BC]
MWGTVVTSSDLFNKAQLRWRGSIKSVYSTKPWYQEPLIHRVVEWFKQTLKVSAVTPAVATPSNPNANL